MEDDERPGRPKYVVNEENAEIVREFIRKKPKSSLKYMESELGISAASIEEKSKIKSMLIWFLRF